MSLRDANDLHHGDVLETDICIVGAGPAGISLALSLQNDSRSVVLLESGGIRQDAAAKDLNVGRNTGLSYYDLDETRHRGLGGASQRWAGWCRPLDESVFGDRPWIGATGWPIRYDELAPFYVEAGHLCELEGSPFDVEDQGLPAVYRPPFVGGGVGVAVWKGSPPTKFGERYRADLDAASNVVVYTHATAVELMTNDVGRAIRAVSVKTATGAVVEVRAPVVVVAAGAVETARLLLASSSTHPGGIGNEHDLVGRYFMEHPHLVTARLVPLPRALTGRPSVAGIDRGLLGTLDRLSIQRPTGARKAAYVVDPDLRTDSEMLSFSTHLRTLSKVDRESSSTYQAFKLVVNNLRSPARLARQVRTRSLPEGTGTQIQRLITGLPEVLSVVYDEALSRPTELALYTQCEQAPNHESRIQLDANHLDANGMPRVTLTWRLSKIDKESVRSAHDVLAAQFLASGLGILVPEPYFADSEDSDEWGPGLRGGHHHMGTARMAVDARHGVVDVNCEVHGVAGLFIGDSSVFPVSGFANPLLTTVAVARRLGAHIRSRAA